MYSSHFLTSAVFPKNWYRTMFFWLSSSVSGAREQSLFHVAQFFCSVICLKICLLSQFLKIPFINSHLIKFYIQSFTNHDFCFGDGYRFSVQSPTGRFRPIYKNRWCLRNKPSYLILFSSTGEKFTCTVGNFHYPTSNYQWISMHLEVPNW